MKIKTSEAIGPALNWLVAKCAGIEVVIRRSSVDRHMYLWLPLDIRTNGGCVEYSPSIDWPQGGPIIERERIEICHWFSDQQWHAANNTKLAYDDSGEFITGSDFLTTGPTPLIAAMRCYCASKLGDEVEIPEELT